MKAPMPRSEGLTPEIWEKWADEYEAQEKVLVKQTGKPQLELSLRARLLREQASFARHFDERCRNATRAVIGLCLSPASELDQNIAIKSIRNLRLEMGLEVVQRLMHSVETEAVCNYCGAVLWPDRVDSDKPYGRKSLYHPCTHSGDEHYVCRNMPMTVETAMALLSGGSNGR